MTSRVLLIDDDEDVSGLLAAHLTRLDCAVTVARCGEEGLRLAAEDPPDVVFLDVLLPGMNGWQVLAAMRRAPALADCRIVITSVLDGVEPQPAGAHGMLPKPFARRDVERTLTAVLRRPAGDPA